MIIEKILGSNKPPPNETWNCWTALNLLPKLPTTSKDICNMKLRHALDEFKKSPSMPTERQLDMTMFGQLSSDLWNEPLSKLCNCTCHFTKRKFIL